MSDQELKKAQVLFKRRKFSAVISMLEPRVIDYRDSFEFFYILGVSCLYMGDTGAAKDYLHRCETIEGTNVSLMIAQAAMYLRRGDTNQAVETYLTVLDYEPRNKIASRAMTFIRTKGDIATISQWVSSGKIKRFYPDPGFYFPIVPVASVALLALVIFLSVLLIRHLPKKSSVHRQGDYGNLELSSDEKRNPADLQSGVAYNTILTSEQITDAYNKAKDYFLDHRDNEAQVEINRILNSNAKNTIREKASTLMEYFDEPTFDSVAKDSRFKNFTFEEVKADPSLYQDCWVIWSGRVTNVRADDSFYECDLLVGYEDWKRLEGVVSLSMQQPVSIDEERPVKVLAKIEIHDNKVLLTGKSYTQSISTANK